MTRSNSAARPAPAPARRRIRGLDAEQRSAQRRSQLLAAATELFAEQSYSGTSIEQICQRAYVGTKGFYDHFDSKEACYVALLGQITAQIQQRVAEVAAESAGKEWPELAATVVEAFVHAIADDPRLAKVTFGEAGGISPAVERQRRENRRWAAAFLDAQWSPGPAPDERAARRRLALALATIGGMFELVADWLHHHDDGGDRDSVETLIADLTEFVQVVQAGRESR
ncbi:TetR/AcrR family transcriptional regulator [Nocardia puris]|uniref:TetR family transcriptional regulator n=1 Tax=Nocardia puris TaxID=208602 RepID=A0A366DCN6_9NOCA|nr:TetR/AcrR family transcriptional regulator [Nocardia puris]MBF6211193.1 TetR/AcrR family transcriptional regulator [Nocardia puris]MBF6364912.1 TetR/AcrR family transcriptional regulator [Nocardia puris]MBF6458698.1 TetR/AcrR family transcriptional regulator [Nocardia puris]RBO87803.1 TetR family transcriptional regulator [Nocardia puris]